MESMLSSGTFLKTSKSLRKRLGGGSKKKCASRLVPKKFANQIDWFPIGIFGSVPIAHAEWFSVSTFRNSFLKSWLEIPNS